MGLAQGNEIEEIAMVAGGGIGPLTRSPGARLRAREAYIEAAARFVLDVPDQPVAPLAVTF
jgi:hypothetical protein